MKDYMLTPLERNVFDEMAQCNPGTTPEMIYKTCHHTPARYYFHYYADRICPPLVDISPLAQLQGLEWVNIYQCEIRDLSPLAQIPSLQSITISGGSEILPCDLTPLKQLGFLCLHAGRCAIPTLYGLPHLSYLLLSTIDSLEPLRGLTALTHLDIGNQNPDLSDLSPLADCPNLESLSAVDTAVRDLTPLAGLTRLKKLVLSATQVTDVSPLASIPTLESVWLYGTAVENVSCLAALPNLRDLNLRKTQVTDLSAFKGREHILGIERKKLGIVKAGKSAPEIKAAIAEIQEKLSKWNVTPRPPLKREEIAAFQERTGIKLPKEYTAFLTKIGDGFEVQPQSFHYYLPPLAQALYDPEGIRKRFSHREAWVWEDDESATGRKIEAATTNGQLQLVDCGCGRSFRLIVCGGAKGEVWDMTDVGIAPYGNGLDFLDWLRDYLDGKVI